MNCHCGSFAPKTAVPLFQGSGGGSVLAECDFDLGFLALGSHPPFSMERLYLTNRIKVQCTSVRIVLDLLGYVCM